MATAALDRKKPLVFGGTVIGALLVLSSVAFACVQSRGALFVTGQNGVTSTAVGNGHHPGAKGRDNYIYCKPGKYLKAGATSFGGSGGSGTFSVRLGAPPADCQYLQQDDKSPWIPTATTPNVFPDGTYEVNFCQGPAGETAFAGTPVVLQNTTGSCFFSNGVTDYGTLVGTTTVTGGAAPAATFRVPFGAFPTAPGTYAGVAVRGTTPCGCGPPPVNVAPISII